MPLITLDPKFHERPHPEQIVYLREGWGSSNQALEQMQEERNALAGKVQFLEQSVANAEQALEIQKAITRNHLTQVNAERQQTAAEIKALQTQLAEATQTIEDLRR